MHIASARYLLAAGLVALSLRGSLASVTITIEDFSRPALAAYSQYGGDMAPAGSALLRGWELGGRYFTFEDLVGDRMMSANHSYCGSNLGIKLALSTSEYKPAWDAAQASEALNLANVESLEFQLVNRVGVAGTPSVVTLTMYYYDTSDSLARTATLFSTNGGAWAVNQTKTFTVATNAIVGFDKASDLVYGFRFEGFVSIAGTYGAIAWTNIALVMPPNPTPPDAVTNLAAPGVEPRAVQLTWTSPADPSGIWDRAVSYDVRYATAPIDDSNWDAATQATGEPGPGLIGGTDTMLVTGLAPLTDYWFAIKSTDTCGNVSVISNVVQARTLDPDVTAPAAVGDLSASDVHPNSLVLHWTATGDDGVAGTATRYDLRYSLSPINETNFADATAVATMIPKVSGSAETLTVHGLSGGVTYYLALKVIDEWPNASGISNLLTVAMPAPDAEPPYAVTDLRLLGTQSSAVHVSFTAPADRGSAGVQGYEIRYSTSPINAGNWGSASLAAPPAVTVPGATVNVAIRNLVGNRTYYVGVKSFDWAEPSNVSDLSNIVSGTTLPPIASITLHNPWIRNDRVADTRDLTGMAATFGKAYTPDGVIVPDQADTQAIAINAYNNFKRREYHWADDPYMRADVIRNINIHGHSLCGGQATQMATILQAMGIRVRTCYVDGGSHTLYEVYYDGDWHLMDTMTTMYVFDRANPPSIASMADISADKTLMTAAVAEGRACPGFLLCPDSVTWFANGTSNWAVIGEPGSTVPTHSMNMDLRYGETLDRTWNAWQNQHPTPKTDADNGNIPGPDAPYHHDCHNDWKDTVNFKYWEPYGAVIPYIHTTKTTYRRWSNGTYDLRPDFGSAGYLAAVYGTPANISTLGADGLMPELHPAAANTLSSIVFKITLPFEITDANIGGDFLRTTAGDVTKIYFSTDGYYFNSLLWENTAVGTTHLQNLNLRSYVFGRFYYWIKVELKGVANKTDAGVNNLVISSIFQHNKGSMAYLDKGVNNITVSFDNPAEFASSGAAFKVTYQWKEYDGTGWTINKTHEQYVMTSPTTFAITTGGTKVPRTESVKMELTEPPFDPIPPAPVSDLDALLTSSAEIELRWTATGDDGLVGQASRYDIRYALSPITDEATWAAATQVADQPAPATAGTVECFVVTGLQSSTDYYFAMKVGDKMSNWSCLSNCARIHTPDPDIIPPTWVGNLVARPGRTSGTVDLTWTATGDDETSGRAKTYYLRYSTAPIAYDDGDATWNAATPVTGLPAPRIAGSAETVTVTGLAGGTQYYFALKVADERPNFSEVSNCSSAIASRLGEKVLQYGLSGYIGCRDNYTQSGTPTSNFGSNERMRVAGYADQSDIERGYIKFDLSSIPAGTVIRKATLCLYSYDTSKMQGSIGYYTAHRITRSWNDMTMTYNIADAGVNWTTAGGDFEAMADGLSPKYAPKVPSWYQWDLTARVQEWINAPAGNFGWLIRAQVETSHLQDQFYQSDTANSSFRPKMVISDLPESVPGDINGDGGVDVVDLLYLVDSFGATCQVDRNYDPRCDLISDQVVDVVDLLTFVECWPQ